MLIGASTEVGGEAGSQVFSLNLKQLLEMLIGTCSDRCTLTDALHLDAQSFGDKDGGAHVQDVFEVFVPIATMMVVGGSEVRPEKIHAVFRVLKDVYIQRLEQGMYLAAKKWLLKNIISQWTSGNPMANVMTSLLEDDFQFLCAVYDTKQPCNKDKEGGCHPYVHGMHEYEMPSVERKMIRHLLIEKTRGMQTYMHWYTRPNATPEMKKVLGHILAEHPDELTTHLARSLALPQNVPVHMYSEEVIQPGVQCMNTVLEIETYVQFNLIPRIRYCEYFKDEHAVEIRVKFFDFRNPHEIRISICGVWDEDFKTVFHTAKNIIDGWDNPRSIHIKYTVVDTQKNIVGVGKKEPS